MTLFTSCTLSALCASDSSSLECTLTFGRAASQSQEPYLSGDIVIVDGVPKGGDLLGLPGVHWALSQGAIFNLDTAFQSDAQSFLIKSEGKSSSVGQK